MVNDNQAKNDMVNHPDHYTQGAVECIDSIQSAMTDEEFLGYLRGNAMKYLWRYRGKGGAEDIRKAIWYQQRMLQVLDGDQTEDPE